MPPLSYLQSDSSGTTVILEETQLTCVFKVLRVGHRTRVERVTRSVSLKLYLALSMYVFPYTRTASKGKGL